MNYTSNRLAGEINSNVHSSRNSILPYVRVCLHYPERKLTLMSYLFTFKILHIRAEGTCSELGRVIKILKFVRIWCG